MDFVGQTAIFAVYFCYGDLYVQIAFILIQQFGIFMRKFTSSSGFGYFPIVRKSGENLVCGIVLPRFDMKKDKCCFRNV